MTLHDWVWTTVAVHRGVFILVILVWPLTLVLARSNRQRRQRKARRHWWQFYRPRRAYWLPCIMQDDPERKEVL